MTDYRTISAHTLPHLPQLLPGWLPGGRIEGREYVTGDLSGGPGRSLSVNLESGIWKDFATGDGGGDPVSLYAAIQGIAQGEAARKLAEDMGINGTRSHQQGKIIKTYDYLDAEGNLLFQVCRKEPKGFTQRRPDGNGGWAWSVKGVVLVPYRLPELLKSPYVYIVEGEQDADKLAALGLPATCNPMGAGKWRQEYTKYFKDKRVCIIPDSDDPGRRHAEQVARSLHGVAAVVKVLALPDLPQKGDASDWLKAGGTKEKLLELTRQASEWVPTLDETPQGPGLRIKLRRGADIAALNIVVEWLVQGLIPQDAVTLFFGRGGIGKTTLTMQMAEAISTGRPFADMKTTPRPVIYVDYENALAVLSARLRSTGCDEVLFWTTQEEPARLDRGPEPFLDLLREYPGAVFVFDTLRSSQGGDENDSRSMEKVMSVLRKIRDAGATVIVLHHTRKGSDRTYKGSTTIFDLVDHVIGLYAVKAPGQDQELDDADQLDNPDQVFRFGTHNKTRYEPSRLFLRFDRQTKLFVPTADPSLEKIERLQGIISDLFPNATQKAVVERAADDLNLSKRQSLALIKQGEGAHWKSQKDPYRKNAIFYETIQFSSFPPTKGAGNWKTGEPVQSPDRETDENATQETLANSEFPSFPASSAQAVKTDQISFSRHQEKTGCSDQAESAEKHLQKTPWRETGRATI